MSETLKLDPQLGWMPAIPLPYYYRGWRTFWMVRPMCWECQIIFKNELIYEGHYALNHIEPTKEGTSR
jgi:hypothetical protein